MGRRRQSLIGTVMTKHEDRSDDVSRNTVSDAAQPEPTQAGATVARDDDQWLVELTREGAERRHNGSAEQPSLRYDAVPRLDPLRDVSEVFLFVAAGIVLRQGIIHVFVDVRLVHTCQYEIGATPFADLGGGRHRLRGKWQPVQWHDDRLVH